MPVYRGALFAGLLACLGAGAASAAIPDSERAVLAAFYASTGGEHWGTTAANVQPWFADADPCNWFGVYCDAAHEHVTVLFLSGNNLTGTLPVNLAGLTKLRSLVVDFNRLTGPIPALAGLTDLQAIFVESNQLTGPLPSFAGVPNLEYFAADHNGLSGHLPASLSQLSRLQYFVVQDNQLSGRVPRAPAALTAFGAALCPNRLDPGPSADPTIDAGWNSATGLASWSSGPASPCTAAPEASALHAFTTSSTGSGDLHSWSEVAGTQLTGLAAADAVCQARATQANLADPGDFVAWLSDRDNDAYCRVFGRGGKKADNCGLDATPVGAGPWLRTDDVPFADTIENALAAKRVFSTLNVDENGNSFLSRAESFTATDVDGTFNTALGGGSDCARWTADGEPERSPLPTLGSDLSAGTAWTYDEHGAGCGTQQRLSCLQKGSAPTLADHNAPGQPVAFVSSATVSGALGGIDGADALCRDLATAAHLYQPESFKALLASATLGLGVADRIAFDGPWYRRDGLLFAHNKAELTGGAVTLPLNVTETGAYLGTAVGLTGAAADGRALPGFDCGAWTTGGDALTRGARVDSIAFAGSNGRNWLSVAEVACAPPAADDWQHHLFCVSDIDAVFHGQFEQLPTTP